MTLSRGDHNSWWCYQQHNQWQWTSTVRGRLVSATKSPSTRQLVHASDLLRDCKEVGHQVFNPQANLGATLEQLTYLLDTLENRRILTNLRIATS
jgi:hypothetical protein